MAVDMTQNLRGIEPIPGGKMIVSMYHPFDAEVAVSVGEWVDARDWESLLAHVTIETTATVIINGSNASTIPANSAHGITLASALTATGIFTLEAKEIPRWVKIRVSAWTSGDVDVDFKIRKRVTDLLSS